MKRMQARLLPDGGRLHLQDGPIDLIIGADGDENAVAMAYRAAALRFESVLDELCRELPLLRAASGGRPRGAIARRMWHAVQPHAGSCFVTPMAAVAGAVAEDILMVMSAAADLDRAFVNNGGDIAMHLASGQSYEIGLVSRPDRPSLFATSGIRHGDPIRGIATSGWRGRSFSLGIADAVTVLAGSASEADAAATVIANAVDLPGHGAIARLPANELQPDSDLGGILVTRAVGPLTPDEVLTALASGARKAEQLIESGYIAACALHLQGQSLSAGSRVSDRIALHA